MFSDDEEFDELFDESEDGYGVWTKERWEALIDALGPGDVYDNLLDFDMDLPEDFPYYDEIMDARDSRDVVLNGMVDEMLEAGVDPSYLDILENGS